MPLPAFIFSHAIEKHYNLLTNFLNIYTDKDSCLYLHDSLKESQNGRVIDMESLKAICLLFTSIVTINAHAYLVNGTMLLNDYQKRKPAATGYIEGVADTGNRNLFCIPAGTGTSQLKETALNYLINNPDLLKKPAALLVSQAFKETFPCEV